MAMRANGRGQIRQDVELLKLTGPGDRQEAGDGAFTVLAPIAKAGLAPLHRMAQGPLGEVVRGLDALLMPAGQEVRMMVTQGPGEMARVRVREVDGACRQGQERLRDRRAQRRF